MSLFLRYYVQDVDTGVYHNELFDTIHDACVWIDKHTPKDKGLFEYYRIVREDQIC